MNNNKKMSKKNVLCFHEAMILPKMSTSETSCNNNDNDCCCHRNENNNNRNDLSILGRQK